MNKSYFAKIIAKDQQGLQMISAYCSESKIKINEIKYLKKNKIFLLSLQRLKKELDNSKNKINSILKFEYINSSRSKNINQNIADTIIELLAIDIFKRDYHYEIRLLFSNNAIITLNAEIIEVTLEDQKKIND
tara:strand:+ start:789 stop:1187 length:399 start_codon:yes stop_codon:yes gene_type:complete